MKLLVTAFKGKSNTSFQLVSQLDSNTLFLNNSFSGLGKDIASLTELYDAVYMFGADKDLDREVRIEGCAKRDLDTIRTGLNIQTLSDQMSAHQIRNHISNIPTQYLCNAAYYHMLCKNRKTVFIHIPSIKGMNSGFMEQLVSLFRDIIYLSKHRLQR